MFFVTNVTPPPTGRPSNIMPAILMFMPEKYFGVVLDQCILPVHSFPSCVSAPHHTSSSFKVQAICKDNNFVIIKPELTLFPTGLRKWNLGALKDPLYPRLGGIYPSTRTTTSLSLVTLPLCGEGIFSYFPFPNAIPKGISTTISGQDKFTLWSHPPKGDFNNNFRPT